MDIGDLETRLKFHLNPNLMYPMRIIEAWYLKKENLSNVP
jgi:hypothetical protein